jgi:hypothetical protein
MNIGMERVERIKGRGMNESKKVGLIPLLLQWDS